jgi:hypothetical protein
MKMPPGGLVLEMAHDAQVKRHDVEGTVLAE